VVQLAGLFLRANHDLPGLPGESFKHVSLLTTVSIHYF
jgi:hypothetical protein